MLMRVLEAGGIPPLIDGRHTGPPPAANPDGFYEHSRVISLPVDTLVPLMGERMAVKLFWRQLATVLAAGLRPACVLATSRPVDESITSYAAHFPVALDPELLQTNRVAALAAAADAGIPVLEVAFHDLIDKPTATCGVLAAFVGGASDVAAMAAVPTSTLRHYPVEG
jgi:hypothetical protein